MCENAHGGKHWICAAFSIQGVVFVIPGQVNIDSMESDQRKNIPTLLVVPELSKWLA